MNHWTNNLLVEDRIRTLHREAEAARSAGLIERLSKAPSDGRPGRPGARFAILRRLVARVAV